MAGVRADFAGHNWTFAKGRRVFTTTYVPLKSIIRPRLPYMCHGRFPLSLGYRMVW